MKLNKILSKKNYPLLIGIALLTLIIPLVIRLIQKQPVLVGSAVYQNILLAQSSSLQINQIYLFVIQIFGTFVGFQISSVIVPLICCVVSIVLFFSLCAKSTNIYKAWIMTLILVSSPAMVFLFVYSSADSLLAMFILLGIHLIQGNKLSKIAAGVVFTLLSLQGWPIALISSLVLIYLICQFKDKRSYALILAMIIFVGLASYLYTDQEPIMLFDDVLSETITDLGAIDGFGVFNILLIALGMFSVWNQKDKFGILQILLLSLIIFSLTFKINLNIFINLAFAFFAGIGLTKFLKDKWQIKILKELTLVLIICGLVFSSFSYINRVSGAYPNQEVIDSLETLKVHKRAITLSDSFNYPFIEYYSQMPVFRDQNISNQIYESRDYYKTTLLLNESNITYIFVDDRMKNGSIWQKEDQGHLFLFRNNQTFKKIVDIPTV